MANSFFELVDQTFRMLSFFGACTGAQLVCIKKACKLTTAIHAVCFLCIIFMYGLATLIISLTFFPTPYEKSGALQYEMYTVVKGIWLCRIVDSTISFIMSNYATKLLTEQGFFDQCRQLGPRTKSPEKLFRSWSRFAKLMMVCIAIFCVAQIPIAYWVYFGELFNAKTTKLDRTAWWLHLPTFFCIIVNIVGDILATLHGAYYILSYWTLCDAVRIHFRVCCDSIASESGATFSRRLIDKYHAEYGRLASMARLLDKAFRFSCLSHLSLAIGSVCIGLFLFFKRSMRWDEIFAVSSTLMMMIMLLICTVVPAVRLADQVSSLFSLMSVTD